MAVRLGGEQPVPEVNPGVQVTHSAGLGPEQVEQLEWQSTQVFTEEALNPEMQPQGGFVGPVKDTHALQD